MRQILLGAAFLVGAVVVGRRKPAALSEFVNDAKVDKLIEKALSASEKAALRLYGADDEAVGSGTWEQDDYEPHCEAYAQAVHRTISLANDLLDRDVHEARAIMALGVQMAALSGDSTVQCGSIDVPGERY